MRENPISTLNTGGVNKLDDVQPADTGNDGGAATGDTRQPPRGEQSLLGIFAVVFGVIGVFAWSVVFVPLALILGVVSLFRNQVGWGLGAIGLALIGFLTSPMLLLMAGLGALATYFHMPMGLMGM